MWFLLRRFLQISTPAAAVLCAVLPSLKHKPCKEPVKARLSDLLKRLKCYRWKLLVHCSAFPHAINNSSFQTKLQSNAAIVSFVAGCGKSVVIYTSAEKQRLLKEQYAWWTISASCQLVFSHVHFKLLCILYSLRSLYQAGRVEGWPG